MCNPHVTDKEGGDAPLSGEGGYPTQAPGSPRTRVRRTEKGEGGGRREKEKADERRLCVGRRQTQGGRGQEEDARREKADVRMQGT